MPDPGPRTAREADGVRERILVVLPYGMNFRNLVLNDELWSHLTARYAVDLLTPLAVQRREALGVDDVSRYAGRGIAGRVTWWLLYMERYLRYLPFYQELGLDAERRIIQYYWLHTRATRRAFAILGRIGATRPGRWIARTLARLPLADRGLVRRFRAKGYAFVLCTHTHELVSIIASRAARDAGIPVACVVLGLDNLVVHGPMLMQPDALLVWGSEQAGEFHRFQCRFEPRLANVRVDVVGNLVYDMYRRRPVTPREAFMRSLDLAEDRRIVLFTTTVDRFVPQRGIAETILRGLASDARAVLVVRPRPGFDLEMWQTFGRAFPGRVRIQTPGGSGYSTGPSQDTVRPEEEAAAVQQFVDTLRHADLIVTSTPSTIWLDALLFQRPVVTVVYNPMLDRTSTPLRLWLELVQNRPFVPEYVQADSPERLAALVADHLSGRRAVQPASSALLTTMAAVDVRPAGERAARALDRLLASRRGAGPADVPGPALSDGKEGVPS